jgi:hypothetical protein
MSRWFVLRDRKPVEVKTLTEWVDWMVEADGDDLTRLGLDTVGTVTVTTVFIGIDTGIREAASPFETAIFDNDGSVRIVGRTESWEDAIALHRGTVNDLQGAI